MNVSANGKAQLIFLNSYILSIDKDGYLYFCITLGNMSMVSLGIHLGESSIIKIFSENKKIIFLLSDGTLYILGKLDNIFRNNFSHHKCNTCKKTYPEHQYCERHIICNYCCGCKLEYDRYGDLINDATSVESNTADYETIYVDASNIGFVDYECETISGVADMTVTENILFYATKNDAYVYPLDSRFDPNANANMIDLSKNNSSPYKINLNPGYSRVFIENNYIRIEYDTHTEIVGNMRKGTLMILSGYSFKNKIPADIDFRLRYATKNNIYIKNTESISPYDAYKNLNPIDKSYIASTKLNPYMYILRTAKSLFLHQYEYNAYTSTYSIKSHKICTGYDMHKDIPIISDYCTINNKVFIVTDSDIVAGRNVKVIDSRIAKCITIDNGSTVSYVIGRTVYIYTSYTAPLLSGVHIIKKKDEPYHYHVCLPNYISVDKIRNITATRCSVYIFCTDSIYALASYDGWDILKIKYMSYISGINDSAVNKITIENYTDKRIKLYNDPSIEQTIDKIKYYVADDSRYNGVYFKICDQYGTGVGSGATRYVLTTLSDEFNQKYLVNDNNIINYNNAILEFSEDDLVAIGKLLRIICHVNKSLQYSLPISLLAAILDINIDHAHYDFYKSRSMSPAQMRLQFQTRFMDENKIDAGYDMAPILDKIELYRNVNKYIAKGFNFVPIKNKNSFNIDILDASMRGFIKIDRKKFISNIIDSNTQCIKIIKDIVCNLSELELMSMLKNWAGNYDYNEKFCVQYSKYTNGISYGTCYRTLHINENLAKESTNHELLKMLLVDPVNYLRER